MIKHGCALLGAILLISAMLVGLTTPAEAFYQLEVQPGAYQLAVIQADRCEPDQPGCLEYHRFVQGICIPGFFLSDPGFPWVLGPCPQAVPTATNTAVVQPTATNTVVQTEPPVVTEPPSETEDPGQEATQIILPTPRSDPGRPHPGGPGNLGVVVSGVLLGASLLGLSGLFLYRRLHPK